MTELTVHIESELKKFSLTDAAITQMEKEYMPLTVKGIDDKDGYKAVRDARLLVKNHRVEVEKTRKALKADSLAFGRAVDDEAKRITAKLEPIETHLTKQEDVIRLELERRKAEEERLRQEKIRGRIRRLVALNLIKYTGTGYEFGDFEIHDEHIATLSDEDFESTYENFSRAVQKEKTRLAEEEKSRQEERERMEAERKRLEAIELEQQKREATLRAEQNKMDAEKKAIAEAKEREEAEKKRQVELEQARKEAAEKARIEAEERAKKEASEKAEAERQAKLEAERQEALKPDKEKLIIFARAIECLEFPALKNKKAGAVVAEARNKLSAVSEYLRKAATEL